MSHYFTFPLFAFCLLTLHSSSALFFPYFLPCISDIRLPFLALTSFHLILLLTPVIGSRLLGCLRQWTTRGPSMGAECATSQTSQHHLMESLAPAPKAIQVLPKRRTPRYPSPNTQGIGGHVPTTSGMQSSRAACSTAESTGRSSVGLILENQMCPADNVFDRCLYYVQ